MRRFFGWLFIIFGLGCFFGGIADPELGAGGGIFNLFLWGFIGIWLVKGAKKNKDKETGKQKVDESVSLSLYEIEEIPAEDAKPAQTVRFACKSCGAKNEVHSTGGSVRCEYCDSPSVPPIPNTKQKSLDQAMYQELEELLE